MSLQSLSLRKRASLALLFDRGYFNDDIITFNRPTDATRWNEKGLLEVVGPDEPRLNYAPSDDFLPGVKKGEPLGILIEEGRENLFEYSEDFSNAYWLKQNGVGISASEVGPDGVANSAFAVTDNSSNDERLKVDVTIPADTSNYVASIFIKKDSNTDRFPEIGLLIDASAQIFTQLNTSTGSITNRVDDGVFDAGVIDCGSYWRLWVSLQNNSSSSMSFFFRPSSSTVFGTYEGTATGTAYVYGAMFEQGSFPTSYIPTNGSTATRGADNCYIDGTAFTNFYNQSEGTWLAEFIPAQLQNASTILEAHSTSLGRLPRIGLLAGSDSMQGSYNNYNAFPSNNEVGKVSKILTTYKEGEQKIYYNGSLVESLTESIANDVYRLDIGAEFGGNRYLNGYLKRLVFFPSILPQADAELLTTL